MATQEQIYSDINQELQTNLAAPADTLSDLQADVDAGNQVAEHRMWNKFFAFASYLLDQLFQHFKTEVNEKVNAPQLYGPRWMQQKVLEYQHGNSLQYSDGVYQYLNPIDTLIKYATVSPSGKLQLIKVAKAGPTQLDQAEKDGLKAYLDKILYPGTHYSIVSQPADDISYEITVYRDPTVMDDSGTLISDGTQPVEAAIQDFVQNLPFDSVFNRNAFIDAIQACPGVLDVVVDRLQYRHGSLAYQDIGREVVSLAGYYNIDGSIVNYDV